MDQNNSTQKISYCSHAFEIFTSEPEKNFGYIEGFCKDVQVKTVNTQKGPAKVANVKVSCVLPDKKVEKLFGKDFVNTQYHSVTFRIAYWNYAADNIESYPPQVNQKVLCLIKNMRPETGTGSNGTIYRTVNATGIDYIRTNSIRKQDGRSSLEEKNEAASVSDMSVAAAPFEEMDQIFDEDLPF